MRDLTDRVFRFINGTVFFTAENGFTGVFVAKCRKNGVVLADVRTENGLLYATTNKKCLPRLFASADEAGADIKIQKKVGLPFLFAKVKRNYGLPVGLLLSLLLIMYLSSVLWSVEIQGVEITDKYEVAKIAEECGFIPGVPLRTLNATEAELKINTLSPYISRVYVNIIGNRAYIDVVEREYTKKRDKQRTFSDIVASKDGEIIKADVFQGTADELNGKKVQKGDILVKGTVLMKNEKTRYVDSEAQIIAQTETRINVSSAKKLYVNTVSKRFTNRSLCLFNMTIPLTQSTPPDQLESNEFLLCTDSSVIPVGILRTTALYLEKKDIELSDEDAYLVCSNDFADEMYDNFYKNNIQCLGEKIKNGNEMVLECVVICKEDICEKKYFVPNIAPEEGSESELSDDG